MVLCQYCCCNVHANKDYWIELERKREREREGKRESWLKTYWNTQRYSHTDTFSKMQTQYEANLKGHANRSHQFHEIFTVKWRQHDLAVCGHDYLNDFDGLKAHWFVSLVFPAVLCSNNSSSGRQEKVPQLLPHRPIRQRCEPGSREVSQLLQLDPCGDPHTGCAEVLRGQCSLFILFKILHFDMATFARVQLYNSEFIVIIFYIYSYVKFLDSSTAVPLCQYLGCAVPWLVQLLHYEVLNHCRWWKKQYVRVIVSSIE